MGFLFILGLIGLCIVVLCLFSWKESGSMTKTGAIVTTIILALLTIMMFGSNAPVFGLVFLGVTLIPGGIWLYKVRRDGAYEAERAAILAPPVPDHPQVEAPALPAAVIEERSRGVGQYFVPSEHPSAARRKSFP